MQQTERSSSGSALPHGKHSTAECGYTTVSISDKILDLSRSLWAIISFDIQKRALS